MKITTTKDHLLEKLELASHFTSNKIGSLTTLQGVLLKNEKTYLHFYATNLSAYFHTRLKTDLENDIKVIVEPKKIIEFLNFLNPGKIELEFKENKLNITQAKARGNFPLLAQEDFPLPPAETGEVKKIKTSFLLKNLPLVIFSASKDDTRPVLSGINFIESDGFFYMVATDGFRLSLVKIKGESQIPSILIPADFVGEVLRQIKGEDETSFTFSPKEKIIVFKVGDNEFFSRLVEGEFPPFEKVIPSESRATAVIDKEELLRNIKLISVFARDYSNVIICVFKDGELEIKPKAGGNEDNAVSQDIEYKGEEQKIAFNYRFILDFLNNIETKKITIDILRPDAPVVFRAEKNPDFLHIIMPVRVQE